MLFSFVLIFVIVLCVLSVAWKRKRCHESFMAGPGGGGAGFSANAMGGAGFDFSGKIELNSEDLRTIENQAAALARSMVENPNMKSCKTSDWTDCPKTGCCYSGKCHASELCYGYRANYDEEKRRDKKGFTRCDASGYEQCRDTGCCFGGVCSASHLCYGNKPLGKEAKGLVETIADRFAGTPKPMPLFGAAGSLENGQSPCTRSNSKDQKSECRSGCCIKGTCQPTKMCFG